MKIRKQILFTQKQSDWLDENCADREVSETVRRAVEEYIEKKEGK